MPFDPGVRLTTAVNSDEKKFVGPILPSSTKTRYPSNFTGPLENEVSIPYSYVATGPDGRKFKLTSPRPLDATQIEEGLAPVYQVIEPVVSEAPAPDMTKPSTPEVTAVQQKFLAEQPPPTPVGQLTPEMAGRVKGLEEFAQSMSETNPEKMNFITQPWAPFVKGVARLPRAFEEGGKQLAEGLDQLSGRMAGVNPETVSEFFRAQQEGREPNVGDVVGMQAGDLARGLLNVVSGALKPLFARGMALTSGGLAFELLNEMATLSPASQSVMDALMSPAERFKLGEKLGVKTPEDAKLVNETLDTIYQIVGFHKINKAIPGGSAYGDFLKEKLSSIRAKAEARGFTFGDQLTLGEKEALAREGATGVSGTPFPEFKNSEEATAYGRTAPPEKVAEMQKSLDLIDADLQAKKSQLPDMTPEQRKSFQVQGFQAGLIREAIDYAKNPSLQTPLEKLQTQGGLGTSGLQPQIASNILPPLPVEMLNAVVQKLRKGKEIPWMFDSKAGEAVSGEPGSTHNKFWGRKAGEMRNKPFGRYDEGKNILTVWGDKDTFNQQDLADALFSLVRQKKVNRDALVYFQDGSNFSVKDAISGDFGISFIPGLTIRASKKLFNEIVKTHISTGGSTYDPRQRKSMVGTDRYSVSIYPDRTDTVPGKDITQQQLENFTKKNVDLLSQPENYIGTWFDQESGQSYLDVVVLASKDGAIGLGKIANQKAVFGLKDFDEVPTMGTGTMPKELLDIPAEGRLNELTFQLAANRGKERVEKGFSSQIFRQPGGERVDKLDVSRSVADYYKSVGIDILKGDASKRERAARFIEQTFPMAEETLRNNPQAATWYKESQKQMFEVYQKYFPSLKEPNEQKLLQVIQSIFSNGQEPAIETAYGLEVYLKFKEKGVIENPEKAGGIREASITRQLDILNNLVKEKGVDGAVRWLEEKHPFDEIQTMREEGGLMTNSGTSPFEMQPDRRMYGTYLFSKKIGPYTANKWGYTDAITKDSWINWLYQLAMGHIPEHTVKIKDPSGKRIGEKVDVKTFLGTSERLIVDNAMKWTAKELGLSPPELQAVLWDGIRKYAEKHGQPMREGHHGDAARWQEQQGYLEQRAKQHQDVLAGRFPETLLGTSEARQASVSGRAAESAGKGAGEVRPPNAQIDDAIMADPFFVGVAIRVGGKVIRGEKNDIHNDLWRGIIRERGIGALDKNKLEQLNREIEDGFLGRDGNFYTRKEASMKVGGPGETVSLQSRGQLEGSAIEGIYGDLRRKGAPVKMSIIPGLGDPGSAAYEKAKKYAGSINVERLNVDEETKKRIHEQADAIKAPLEKLLGRTLTNDEVVQAAIDSEKFREVLPKEMQTQLLGQILKLRQIVTRGAKEPQAGRQYFEDFVRLQSVAKFAGRMLQAFKIQAEEPSQAGRTGAAGLALTVPADMRERVLSRILDATDNAQAVISRAQGVDWSNAGEVTQFYREFVKPTANELLDEFRYINMLSSPRTHIVNSFSNIIQTVALAPATKLTTGAVDMVASALSGKQRETYLRETPAYVRGLFSAIPSAAKNALDVMTNKIPMERFDVRNIPSAGQASSPWMRPIAKFNQAFSIVPRALEASDVFFRTLAEGGETEAGVRGLEIGGRPLDLQKVRDDAMRAAAYWVFRSPIDVKNEYGQGRLLTAVDKATQGIYSLRKTVPGVRWFIPFLATPMNILKQGIEFSPAGFLTMVGSKKPTEQFSKALIGSAVFAGAASVVMNGNATWEFPASPSERADFEAQGKIPYAVKIGDTWVSYSKIGPLAYPIALAAAVKHYSELDKYKDESALKKLSASLSGYAKFFSDQSYVQGIADLVEVIQGSATMSESALANMGRQVVPLNALQNWVESVIDPLKRAPANFMERIASGIPGVAARVTPRIGPMGQEVRRPGIAENLLNLSPLPASRNTSDPIWKAVQDKGLKVGVPSRSVFGSQLSIKRYQAYIKEVGLRVRQDLIGVLGDLQTLPKSQAQEMIDDIVRSARKNVREELFPDLQQAEELRQGVAE